MGENGSNGNGHLPIHELATMFPPMGPEEYAGLKADIDANGVHQSVAVWQGSVIDGRHRYQACLDLGLYPPIRYLEDEVDPVVFVLSANMSRRQLTPSQKTIITAQLPHLVNGTNRHTLESERSNVAHQLLGSNAKTTEERAAIAGVGTTYQQYADAIVKYGDQEVINKVYLGDISVEDAYKGINGARKAKVQAEKAEKARRVADAAEATEREAVEKARAEREAAEERARAEREAAETAEREAVEKARAEREAAETSEREAVEKARAEREAAEERARKAQETAATAEREAVGKAKAEREATEERARAEREAAEAAEREAVEKARADLETEILRVAQQQCAEDPNLALAAAVKEQRRKYALRAARESGDQSPYINNSGDVDLSKAVLVGRHSRVVFADSLDPLNGLPTLPDEVAALTFTSPPYWTFAEYGNVGVGYEDSYAGYIESLRRVFTAIWRKTLPGGRAIVNISNMKSRQVVEGAAFIYPIVADLTRVMDGIGFTFFDEIIWHKRDTTTGPMNGNPLWGSYPYPPTPKILDSTFENILVFSKPGHRNVEAGVKEQSRLTMEEWREYTKGVWRIESGSVPNHPATFPMALADRVIRMYSFVNDVVLDPFAGTATTVLSAERNGRAGVGYEISSMYKSVIQEKSEHWLEGM